MTWKTQPVLLKGSVLCFAHLFLLAAHAMAMDWAAWVECIGKPGFYCSLDPGAYPVSTTLEPANGVTMVGGGGSPGNTVLYRECKVGEVGQRPTCTSPPMHPIIRIKTSTTVNIQRILINGNRPIFRNWPIKESTNQYWLTTDVDFDEADRIRGPQPPEYQYGCVQANLALFDFEAEPGSTAYVYNVNFQGGPGHAALLANGYIWSSSITAPRSTGVILAEGGGGMLYMNSFYLAGTAGATTQGYGNYIWFNNFFLNRYEMPDDSGGGQVYVHTKSFGAVVTENIIDGNDWQTGFTNINGCYPPVDRDSGFVKPQATYGIEVDFNSRSTNILNNEVTRHTGAGIEVIAADGIVISGNPHPYSAYYGASYPRNIHDNVGCNPPFGNAARGISIFGAKANEQSPYTPSRNVSLESIRSVDNSGHAVYLSRIPYPTTGPGYLQTHTLSARSTDNCGQNIDQVDHEMEGLAYRPFPYPYFPYPNGTVVPPHFGLGPITVTIPAGFVTNPIPNGVSPPPFSPRRLNVGGGLVVDGAGRTWSADSGAGWYGNAQLFATNTTIGNVPSDSSMALYQTCRYGAGISAIGYSETALPSGNYRVLLKFSDPGQPPGQSRKFDIRVNGNIWLSAFEIQSQAGGYNRAVDLSTEVTVYDTGGFANRITLDFIPFGSSNGDPMVNAIEISKLP